MSREEVGESLLEQLRKSPLGFRLSQAARRLVELPVAAARLKNAVSATSLPFGYPTPKRNRLSLGPALQVLAGRSGPREDLRETVSVCVATVGLPCYAATREGLARQDCEFAGPYEVRNVSPSALALQRLTERSTTPVFVQLGEDMVLKPYAVRAMTKALLERPAEVAGLVFPLWDTHLRRMIMGVKVLRTEVLQRIPYRSVSGTGYDLERRLNEAGLRLETVLPYDLFGREVTNDPNCFEVMGEHLVEGETLLFERYRATFGYSLDNEHMDYLWRDFRRLVSGLGLAEPGRQEDLWALLGAAAGLANPVRRDRSFHLYDSTPGLREIRYMLKGGPDELVLLSGGQAGLAVLERALALFTSLESLTLRASAGKTDPVDWPDLPRIAARSRGGGLELKIETRAPLKRVPLELREAALEWVGDPSAIEAGALDALREWTHPDRVLIRLHVSRVDLLDEDRRLLLQRALERAEALGALVALCHALPPAEGSRDWEEAFWTEALCEEDPLLVGLEELKASAPSLRLPLALRAPQRPESTARESTGREWTRCDSPFRALAVDSEGYVSGCRAGLRPNPRSEELPIFAAEADELWFERQPRYLRNELLGKRPLHPTCQACHWNHSG